MNMRYSLDVNQTGGREEYIEFLGVSKIVYQKDFQDLIKMEIEFAEVIKTRSYGITIGFVFWH